MTLLPATVSVCGVALTGAFARFLIRGRFHRLLLKHNGDFLPGRSPSPNGNRHVPLQDHVIFEQRRELDLRASCRCE
jgi:hypothetical protein